MSQSLAVKYRPTTFVDVVGQTVTTKILSRQIELHQFKNCYLFCGASGCGKTTIARIFASEINHGVGYPIEVDGASNNGVDNVKQIIKTATERAIDSEYKVYIIDECHALSNAAWQAFLKCIEEPPEYTIFIFCTTDPQKIPTTILNRVQRFNFNRINHIHIKSRLEFICNSEHYVNYVDACDYISRTCNGQMRDAIATLEKCVGYSEDLSIENVMRTLGDYSFNTMFDILNYIIDGNESSLIMSLSNIFDAGGDMKLFVNQFFSFVLDVQKYAICKDLSITKFPITMQESLKRVTNFENVFQYYGYINSKLLKLKNVIKDDSYPITTITVYMLEMCRLQ